jgi:hypothetical protein
MWICDLWLCVHQLGAIAGDSSSSDDDDAGEGGIFHGTRAHILRQKEQEMVARLTQPVVFDAAGAR